MKSTDGIMRDLEDEGFEVAGGQESPALKKRVFYREEKTSLTIIQVMVCSYGDTKVGVKNERAKV